MDNKMMKCNGGNMVIKRCCDVLRIAIGITMLALLLAGNANAATITVNASGGGDYLKIQKAINASSNGDTILVYSGIYHENVNITKQLTLRGIGNPVVDAGGSGSAITLSANGITLEGFKATGSGNDQEAGIRVTSFNNTLTGNKASKNYNGIYLDMSCNNTLTGNNALNNNYGISLYESSVKYGIYLSSSSNNTIRGNIDGISLSSSSSNTLTGNNGG